MLGDGEKWQQGPVSECGQPAEEECRLRNVGWHQAEPRWLTATWRPWENEILWFIPHRQVKRKFIFQNDTIGWNKRAFSRFYNCKIMGKLIKIVLSPLFWQKGALLLRPEHMLGQPPSCHYYLRPLVAFLLLSNWLGSGMPARAWSPPQEIWTECGDLLKVGNCCSMMTPSHYCGAMFGIPYSPTPYAQMSPHQIGLL